KGAQFALTLQGRAMNDAERGQIVRVLNPQSRAIVEAVAVSAGLAETVPRASALITAERP
ncbi:MAG TPA: flagella basal body P-ring formation protein FlgA, partial [Hyphomonadaceae bacterium]|nr:flagella basal body P-ring formation protein FlgA [Hyphomonadaceae bacterium]